MKVYKVIKIFYLQILCDAM